MIKSAALRRLIEEVRQEEASGTVAYNRMHNRHNRSLHPPPQPTPTPEKEEKDGR